MKKSNISRFKLRSILVISIILLLSGCQVSKGLGAIMNKKVDPQYYTFKDKSIIFTPFVHFGQKEFYSSLKDSIVNWKKEGYTVFYEQVTSGQEHLGLDSISYDRLNRKYRRINGENSSTAEDYEKELQTVFKKGIAQPKYIDLGIDSTDISADITFLDLVNKMEEYFGEIKLDSCDYAIPLDSTYTCSKGFKAKKLDPVYIDYRNKMVVEKIVNSKQDKIVILFGAAHIKGMKKLLKQH